MIDLTAAVFDEPCPRCKAGPGESCVFTMPRLAGQPMDGTHHVRDLLHAGVVDERGVPVEKRRRP